MQDTVYSPYLFSIDDIIKGLQQAENNAIPRALTWMKDGGTSVLLNWSENDNLWECSWITGGKRYTGATENMTTAIVACLLKVKHRK